MNIDERLREATCRIRERDKFQASLETAHKMQISARNNWDKAKKRLAFEEKDLEKLDGKTLVSLWHSIMGTTEAAKRKEQEEYLEAKLKFDDARAALEKLDREVARLERELAALGDPEGEYQRALMEKEEFLLQSGGPTAQRLLLIAEQTGAGEAREKELGEAIEAGKKAEQAMAKAENSLNHASGWGVVDILGGGLLTTAIKHSNINDARAAIRKAQDLLRRFQQELSDVQKDMQVDIGLFLSLADYFFDGLVFDIFVQSQINTALDRTRQLRRRIRELLEELNQMRVQNQERLQQFSLEKNHLLKSDGFN